MALISDAQQVLTEPRTRRVYDVIWRERSRKVAIENRRRGELRGDWETRYRWEVAEMAVTSALIPLLSVYWRLRGALRFRGTGAPGAASAICHKNPRSFAS